jgi:hypothetical protein
MKSLMQTLVDRDGITEEEARSQIAEARERLLERLSHGEMPDDFCEEEFGLEPDYIEDLIG